MINKSAYWKSGTIFFVTVQQRPPLQNCSLLGPAGSRLQQPADTIRYY
jgi:hypothetical protein